MTTLTVTDLVAVQPPDPLATFLDFNGYLPIGVPMLKRVLALPKQTVCRNGLTIAVDGIEMGQAHERDGKQSYGLRHNVPPQSRFTAATPVRAQCHSRA